MRPWRGLRFLTEAFLTFVSKCESEPAATMSIRAESQRRATWAVPSHPITPELAAAPGYESTHWASTRGPEAALPASPPTVTGKFLKLGCALDCGAGGKDGRQSEVRQPVVTWPCNTFLLSTYCVPGALLSTEIPPRPSSVLLECRW